MLQIRFFLLIITLNFVSVDCYSLTKPPSNKEIATSIKQAAFYYQNSDFEKSLVTARIALRQALKTKDANLIAKCYKIIGANLEELSEFEKAIHFYKKGLFYVKNTNNDSIEYIINNHVGKIYCFEKKEYKKGINFYKSSLENGYKLADTSIIVLAKIKIAWAFFDLGLYDKGFPYLKFINTHHKKFGDKTSAVAINMLNGMYYGSKDDRKRANASFLKGIKLGNEGNKKLDFFY